VTQSRISAAVASVGVISRFTHLAPFCVRELQVALREVMKCQTRSQEYQLDATYLPVLNQLVNGLTGRKKKLLEDIGLFYAISVRLLSFDEWDTGQHGHLLNNNLAACEAMTEVRKHVPSTVC
jgi:hypothetical protein